ncbi:hypothetical protein F5146DRAFT_1139918 [Armillaria mellea]|nr:hypothetical protein F5146DRAFT_1139918 [Armillaria mellea]
MAHRSPSMATISHSMARDACSTEKWDSEDTNGGVDKPHPFLKFKGSSTYSDLTVFNNPAQAISIGDNNGDTDDIGHNTDGFDVSADDVNIQISIVKNQDSCIAINDGSSIIFKNKCSGGHGISTGSIASSKSVTDVTLSLETPSRARCDSPLCSRECLLGLKVLPSAWPWTAVPALELGTSRN